MPYMTTFYSSDSPQVRAAKVSGEARRQRAQERRARERRHAEAIAAGRLPGHHESCQCDHCCRSNP